MGTLLVSDDWQHNLYFRGFQVSLDEQQIGITVDGIRKRQLNYGGGAKANRLL